MAVFYGLFAEGRWEDRRQANVIDGAAHYYRAYETADGRSTSRSVRWSRSSTRSCARSRRRGPTGGHAEAWAADGKTIAARFRRKSRANGSRSSSRRVVCRALGSPRRRIIRRTLPDDRSWTSTVRCSRTCSVLADRPAGPWCAGAPRRPHPCRARGAGSRRRRSRRPRRRRCRPAELVSSVGSRYAVCASVRRAGAPSPPMSCSRGEAGILAPSASMTPPWTQRAWRKRLASST